MLTSLLMRASLVQQFFRHSICTLHAKSRSRLRFRSACAAYHANFIAACHTNAAATISSSLPSTTEAFGPPAHVRGMKILDKSQFAGDYQIPVLNLTYEQSQNFDLVNSLRKLSPKFLGISNIQDTGAAAGADDVPSSSSRYFKKILLNPDLLYDLPQLVLDIVANDKASLQFETLHLTYENWTAHDAVNAVLPPYFSANPKNINLNSNNNSIQTTTTYAHQSSTRIGQNQIGHILRLDLVESQLPYRKIIGEILLEKCRVPEVRTVVNIEGERDANFRFFKLELLAGDADFMTETEENGCRYRFDISRVFWSPVLRHEHERLTSRIVEHATKESDGARTIVFDLFAGAGPFTIPLAKRLPASSSRVYANDLNPDCVKWLQVNAALNEVNDDSVLECPCSNMDTGEYIRNVMPKKLSDFIRHQKTNDDSEKFIVHFIMNLPYLACSFLHNFVNVFSDDDEFVQQLIRQNRIQFVVHLYYDYYEYFPIAGCINNELGTKLGRSEIEYTRVFEASKLRATFTLPVEILVAPQQQQEQQQKQQTTTSN